MGEALHMLLERNARKYPNECGVLSLEYQTEWSWQELNQRANGVAETMLKKGLKKGDRIALVIPNRPEFLAVYFGVLKAGGVVVPVNVRLAKPEVEYLLNDSQAVGAVFDPGMGFSGQEISEKCETLQFYLTIQELEDGDYDDPKLDILVSDVAEILYTSGTTGKPKGVVLTHNCVYEVGTMMAYEAEIKYGDRALLLMPLTHSAPLNLFVIGAVYAGAACVVGNFTTPQAILKTCHEAKTTHFFGAPVAYLLALQIDNFNDYDLSSTKLWTYGGAPMAKEAIHKIMSKFPGKFMSLYGLTESGPNGVAMYHEQHEEHAGSIGNKAAVNCEYKVLTDEGKIAGPGEKGEVYLKSPSVMLEYLNKPEATKEVLENGWIKTGDIAEIDDKGYLWIMGRKKDIILSGGVNVYPKEIENALAQHSAVADVAVIGVPHKDWGETVMAVVVLKPGVEKPDKKELQEFCGKFLADFKVPRLIRFDEVIPRNASGKILKHLISREV